MCIDYSMAGHTFFSSSYVKVTKIDYILSHKTHLNTFKRIEIIQSLLLDDNGTTLEINNIKNSTLQIPEYMDIKQHSSK